MAPVKNIGENLIVTSVDVKDIRWPTSLGSHGSDAMVSLKKQGSRRQASLYVKLKYVSNSIFQHTDPDYSCAYVTISINDGSAVGYGLTFTCGRGTEIVAMTVKALRFLIVGRKLNRDIYARFGEFWRDLTSESQLRWVGEACKNIMDKWF